MATRRPGSSEPVEGWWRASDGRYYPPQDFAPAPPRASQPGIPGWLTVLLTISSIIIIVGALVFVLAVVIGVDALNDLDN